jgi:pilus assembly protein CpaD
MRRLALAAIALPALLGGCLSPQPPMSMPDESIIGLDGARALPPDCMRLMEPSQLSEAGHTRPAVAFGCATYTNLAAELVRPEDLVAPKRFGGPEAAVAASAVARYQGQPQKAFETNPVAITTLKQ